MNPLGVSLAFVICSVLLSSIKRNIFDTNEQPTSVLKISQTLQLTNTKQPRQSKHYRSLYQAFYRNQLSDPTKSAANSLNRSNFNQSVLSTEFETSETSMLCGVEMLVLVSSGVQAGKSGHNQWVNILEIYKMPMLQRLHEVEVKGRLSFPTNCKKLNQAEEEEQQIFEIVAARKNGFVRILVSQMDIQLQEIESKADLFVGGFDFVDHLVAYWSQEQPWQVVIENLTQPNKMIPTINILPSSSPFPQHISITQIILSKSPVGTSLMPYYLTIIFTQQSKSQPSISSISFSTYKVSLESEVELVQSSVVDSDRGRVHFPAPACQVYWNREMGSFDLSCIVSKQSKGDYRFCFYHAINLPLSKHSSKYRHNQQQQQQQPIQIAQHEDEDEEQDNEQKFLEEEEKEFEEDAYGDMQEDEYDEMNWFNLLFDSDKEQQPTQESQAQNKSSTQQSTKMYRKLLFSFSSPGTTHQHLLKPSTPNPIILSQTDSRYYLYMFAFPRSLLTNPSISQAELSSIQRELTPPPPLPSATTPSPSSSSSSSSSRSGGSLLAIQVVEEESTVVVVWTTGIEVYAYEYLEEGVGAVDGIPFATVLPFIELFATVYCILRSIWTQD